MPFAIEFAEITSVRLAYLRPSERSLVIAAVKRLLANEPLTETRNRKPMRPNRLATWELRVQHLRVFYDVDSAKALVKVLAIGRKIKDKLIIGREYIQL